MVIPIYDVNPVRRTPWVTYALIAANVIALLLTPLFANAGIGSEAISDLCHQTAFFQHYAAIPKELISNVPLPLVATGAVGHSTEGLGCVIAPPAYHKSPPLSVLTSMFLHGGWLHLLGNMLFLWVFGNNIEDRLGRIGFLTLYLVSGYAAAYGFALANPDTTEPLIGASGAVSGILGAYLVLFPRARVWSLVPILFFIPLRLPAWVVLGTWFVLQWLFSSGIAVSEGGEVAYLAHVIGFAIGVIAALPFRDRRPPPVPRQATGYAEPPVMWRKTDRGGWR
jgi:membrane associated rhomboid family serine protease